MNDPASTRGSMKTDANDGGNLHSEPGAGRSGLRQALTYLTLVPVLIGVGAASFFAVRMAIRPPAHLAGEGGGRQAISESELVAVEVIVGRAREHLVENRTSRAEALVLAGIERFPREQALWLLYAEVLMDQGNFEKALAAFETAIDIGPDHPEYRNAAGTLASQLGDKLTAELHWTTGQRLNPKDPRFPFFLAQNQRAQGRIDEARANLVMAVRLDPELAEGWGTLAMIALDEGNYGPALQHLEKAKALEPDRALWRMAEARVHRRQGNPERALAVLSAIPEEQRFTDPMILHDMGLCFGMLRRPMDAAEEYLDALAYLTLRDDKVELVYNESGAVVHDPRTPRAVRRDMHYEAALWLERAGDLQRAANQAMLAQRLGHEGAADLIERLKQAGYSPTSVPPTPEQQ
jgi:tetratricopeptide (TPR) repeat protein